MLFRKMKPCRGVGYVWLRVVIGYGESWMYLCPIWHLSGGLKTVRKGACGWVPEGRALQAEAMGWSKLSLYEEGGRQCGHQSERQGREKERRSWRWRSRAVSPQAILAPWFMEMVGGLLNLSRGVSCRVLCQKDPSGCYLWSNPAMEGL